MTRETAKKKIRGFSLQLQDIARRDIENRAYKTIYIVPKFQLEDGYFQMTVNYTVLLEDKKLHGKAHSNDEFIKMYNEADRGEMFMITYLEESGIILEIENQDDQ